LSVLVLVFVGRTGEWKEREKWEAKVTLPLDRARDIDIDRRISRENKPATHAAAQHRCKMYDMPSLRAPHPELNSPTQSAPKKASTKLALALEKNPEHK
jgi:hypothetical protein